MQIIFRSGNTDFLLDSFGKAAIKQGRSKEEVESRIWDLPAEIFIPAAASRLVNADQVMRMKNAGMQVIASGANVPFSDPEIFFGPIMENVLHNNQIHAVMVGGGLLIVAGILTVRIKE